MGRRRRPYAAWRNTKAQPVQGSNPYSDMTDYQPEPVIPAPRDDETPVQQPGLSANQLGPTVEKSLVVETNNLNPETQQYVSKSRKKKPRVVKTIIRRSMRLRNAVVAASSRENERIPEEVILDADDPVVDPDVTTPEPNLDAVNLEEKLDLALHRLEEQEKAIDMLQSKVNESSGMDENISAGNARYRSMYIESQKKIEELTMETQHLAGKLEYALGQIVAFEKQGRTLIEALEKMKDALAISNLITTIETTVCAAITNATKTALNNMDAAKEPGVSTGKRRRDAPYNKAN